MHWLAEAAFSSLKEGFVISLINVPIGFVVPLFVRLSFVDSIGLVLLLEATALMLAGGAMELGATASSQKLISLFERKRRDWTRESYEKAQHKAAVYTITGLGLFAESLLLAIIIAK